MYVMELGFFYRTFLMIDSFFFFFFFHRFRVVVFTLPSALQAAIVGLVRLLTPERDLG